MLCCRISLLADKVTMFTLNFAIKMASSFRSSRFHWLLRHRVCNFGHNIGNNEKTWKAFVKRFMKSRVKYLSKLEVVESTRFDWLIAKSKQMR